VEHKAPGGKAVTKTPSVTMSSMRLLAVVLVSLLAGHAAAAKAPERVVRLA